MVRTATWLTTIPLQTPLDWFGVWLVWICFAAIASLLIFLFIAMWLYRDAESRGMSGGLWVILLVVAGFFVPIIGGIIVLVIYLIVRMEHPMGYGYGPYPPAPPPPAYVAPPAPAAPPAPTEAPTTCKSCGAPVPPRAAYCANCGSKV